MGADTNRPATAYDTAGYFWILDVGGQRLVIETAEDIAERDAIFDSIRIEP
ncbi:MAG: hypothetical protein ACRDZU_08620 [Acidimicrobiales bacterium]